MYRMEPVGIVHNNCKNPDAIDGCKESESVVEIYESYVSGLFMTEVSEFLDVVFYFHLSAGNKHEWQVITPAGEKRGVFASRSPKRPNAIGVTTVRVLGRDGNKLRVTGLDAIDGTPVLDLKACDSSFYENSSRKLVHTSVMKTSPRITVWKQIKAGDTEKLLLDAGRMHGHYCPGLAMGVMAATYAMQQMQTDSDGLEDLLAVLETNNCLADGVQYVTGCTFGNNSLIFHDLGKMAFTLTKRDGKGLRIIARPESRSYIREKFPDFEKHYESVVADRNRDPDEVATFKKTGIDRAFGTLKLDFHKLFETKQVDVEIPDYAPSHDDIICSKCGENVMASRVVEFKGQKQCLSCSKASAPYLDGHGIGKKKYE